MRLFKRSISVLLVLLLVFCIVPAAEAKTGTLVKNTGTRHELCTALSSQAQAYYTGDNTYDVVSRLSASSSAPMSSAMFSRLHTLMTDTMTNSVTYKSLTGYWPKTDANHGSSNPVLFYSDVLSGNYNREHVWPKSRASFYQSGGGSDLHHLRPTNADVNSARSNYTFGNVVGYVSSYQTKTYDGKTVLWYISSGDGLVEVNDNIKGDVARILLYVWCRWEEPNLYENDPSPVVGQGDDKNDGKKVIESLDTLLRWMEKDPVDTWEMSRNDQCENVQGNRNVFIDYPEYAWLLFDRTPPTDYRTPSGMAMSGPATPTATPTATATATATSTATATPTPTPTPTATPTPTPEGSPTTKPRPTLTPTPAPTPTPPPAQDPALPGAVVLPRSGDYVARIDGGYAAEHMETVDGTACLRVDLYLDGVTADCKLSSISFKLVYDPAQLTYVKYAGMGGSGAMSAANPNAAGLFQYSFISTNGTLTNGKPLLTLYFRLADGLPSGTQIRFGFSEPIKASSLGEGYTSDPRSVGVQLKPYVIDKLWGDANCDGEVTAADASLVLRALVGLETLSGQGLLNAKVEGKPTLSAQDAALILRRVVGLIAAFPVEG